MLTQVPNDVTSRLNAADPNDLADLLRLIGLGDFLRSTKVSLFKQVPVALAYAVATAIAIQLPDNAKALSVKEAYVRAGTTPGPLVCDAAIEAAPASGHCGVSPSRDITFLAADGATSVDVVYECLRSDAVEQVLACNPGTGVVAIPPAWLAADGSGLLVNVYEIEILAAGISPTKCIVDVAGTATPASGHGALNAAKNGVSMHVADAVTSVRVKAGLIPAIDMNAVLAGASQF